MGFSSLPSRLSSKVNGTLPAYTLLEEAHTPSAELSELTSKSCNPKPRVLVEESRFLEVPIK